VAHFRLNPSYYFLAFIVIAVLLSVGVIIILEMHWYLKIFTMSCVFIYAWYCLYKQGFLKSSTAIIEIIHIENQDWYLLTATNHYQAELLGDSTMTTKLSILRFSIPGKFFTKSCVIFSDSMACDHYKQLLIRVKAY